MNKKSNLPELLRLCRERAGLTQSELAKRLYVDRTIVTKAETGKITPSYMLVKEWAKETNSTDIIGMDFSGVEGWNKLRQLELTVKSIKSQLELVPLMRVKLRR